MGFWRRVPDDVSDDLGGARCLRAATPRGSLAFLEAWEAVGVSGALGNCGRLREPMQGWYPGIMHGRLPEFVFPSFSGLFFILIAL